MEWSYETTKYLSPVRDISFYSSTYEEFKEVINAWFKEVDDYLKGLDEYVARTYIHDETLILEVQVPKTEEEIKEYFERQKAEDKKRFDAYKEKYGW